MIVFYGKITVSEANKQQRNLLKAILQLIDKVRPRSKADKVKNKCLWKFKWPLWRQRINS